MVQWRKRKKENVLENPLHRWLAWFDEDSGAELIEEVVNMDSAIKAAYRKLEHVMQDEEAYRFYWSQRKAEHDLVSGLNGARREGIEQGILQGREQTAFEIARKMKELGDSDEKIQMITGLSAEEVKKL